MSKNKTWAFSPLPEQCMKGAARLYSETLGAERMKYLAQGDMGSDTEATINMLAKAFDADKEQRKQIAADVEFAQKGWMTK